MLMLLGISPETTQAMYRIGDSTFNIVSPMSPYFIMILGFIQNGLLLLGYPYYTQWLVTWVVIILAVWLDLASRRRRLFTAFS